MDRNLQTLKEKTSSAINIINEALELNRDETVSISSVTLSRSEAGKLLRSLQKIKEQDSIRDSDTQAIPMKLISSSIIWRDLQIAINKAYIPYYKER